MLFLHLAGTLGVKPKTGPITGQYTQHGGRERGGGERGGVPLRGTEVARDGEGSRGRREKGGNTGQEQRTELTRGTSCSLTEDTHAPRGAFA